MQLEVPPGSNLEPLSRATNAFVACSGVGEASLVISGPLEHPFYQGEIARAIVTTVSQRGGLLTAEDLAAYRIRWRVPLRGAYRGRKILTMPPPG